MLPTFKATTWFGLGAAVGGPFLQWWIPTVPPLWPIVLGFVSVGSFTLGLWEWSGKFAATAQQNRKNETRKMRLALAILFAAACVLGLVLLRDLAPKPPLDAAQMALLDRYKQFYEKSEAPNKTTLIEMTNSELKTRTANVASRLTGLSKALDDGEKALRVRFDKGEFTEPVFQKMFQDLTKGLGEEYGRYRVDASMCLQELRNRVPPEARKHFPGIPGIRDSDPRGGAVVLTDLLPNSVSVMMVEFLVRELEMLSKLLPD